MRPLGARHAYAKMVRSWMWWSVFTLGREVGGLTIAKAHRAAESAVRKLYP